MNIKIVRTSTVEYKAKDQDLDYYRDHDVFNNDQIALQDLKDLEDGDINMEDLDGGSVEHEYKVTLVDDDLVEHEPDEANDERDLALFPITEDEKTGEDDEADPASVAEKRAEQSSPNSFR